MNPYRLLLAITALAAATVRPALSDLSGAPVAADSLAVVPDSSRATSQVPDPRAFRDSSLTKAEQEAKDIQFRKELEQARIDSLHLNTNPRLFLHAAPTAAHRTTAEVARTARSCDSLVTAVPPGEWDVFLIAAGHDLLNGIAFSFGWPEDWVIRGFTLSPDLKTPFSMGDLKAQDLRPTMVAFDCVANEARKDAIPPNARSTFGDLVVIGRLEVVATSPGSLTLLDHSDARYGAPKVANCWNKVVDVPVTARGRIDVGSGPGVRPCDTGGPLVPNLMANAGALAGEGST
jgi:hypothetical protein